MYFNWTANVPPKPHAKQLDSFNELSPDTKVELEKTTAFTKVAIVMRYVVLLTLSDINIDAKAQEYCTRAAC